MPLLVLLIAAAGSAAASTEAPHPPAPDDAPPTTSNSVASSGRRRLSIEQRRPARNHEFLFMGGLQRSGTTWLESLVGSSRVSGLSFDNVDLAVYRQRRPWQLQNHTQEYFETVVRSGGVEGKFVQSAYPYAYLVRDVGKNGKTLDDLLLDASAASPRTASKLYDEWSIFWDTSKPVLLEKTPENFLMGPFLQAAFGASTARFAFVMRHPLVWALAIEKWIFPNFEALRTVEDRIAFWFDCMSRAVEHLPQLKEVIVMQLETASASSELQAAVARHLLCSGNFNKSSLAQPNVGGESKEILSSSLAYVTCWLSGMEFKSSVRKCVPRKAFRDPAFRNNTEQLAADTRWRLKQIARQREAQANQFGYTFKPFLALARKQTDALLRERIAAGAPASMAAQLGAASSPVRAVRSVLRPSLVVLSPEVSAPAAEPSSVITVAATANARKSVIVVFHKMGFDRDKPSGMDLRMTQIVSSLVSMQHTVHFVCHCHVHASQLSPFEAGVVIYTGSMQEQLAQAAAAAVPNLRSVLIFFTTLTMFVHQRMMQGEEWYTEPTTQLPEEQVLSWVRARPNMKACTVAVADDIHYLRAVEVMARHDAVKAKLASEWIRRRELGFHSAVDGTATVSLEDATTLTTALATGPRRSPACTSGCGCSMTWVPYIQTTRSESSIEPFDRRIDGMLYVGGMHGLAVIAMEWLLQKVQPLIASSAGEAELLKGGKGHLHLAGPGWGQQWAGSSVINKSVAAGHVSVLGILSDMQLDQRLQDHKVFVAPVLNGTGIATKNVLAMAHGIPLVTTLVGLNGLGLPNEQRAILVGDSPSAFAHHVLKVQSSEKVFSTTWRAALEHTRTYLSADRQRSQLCQMMGCTSQPAAAAVRPTETTRKVGLCEAADTPLRRAADTPPTAGSPAASPVVLLGLAGTNVSSLAAALRSPRVCLVADPLQGLQRAPVQSQLEHLQSLLTEPSYCHGADQEAGHHANASPLLLHGFALELPAVEPVASSLLASASGLQQLAQLLRSAKVVVVRRCPTVGWAVERLLPPAVHSKQSLNPAQVVAEMQACTAQDEALRQLVNGPAIRSTTFDIESGHLTQIKTFLGLPHAHPMGKALTPPADDWASMVSNAVEIRNAAGAAAPKCSTAALPAATPQSLQEASTTLATRTRRRRPLLAVGAHGVEGGASLVGKVLAEACRAYLTPRLGWRCVVKDDIESCDPDSADLCFQRSAHFSAGRYSDRGYRFVHVVRSPMDVLTRSYQLLEPNATHARNATDLANALELQWKGLSGGALHMMQDMDESQASDLHAYRIRFEDLLPEGTPNATLAQLFAFLLDKEAADATVDALVDAAGRVLSAAGKAEQLGDTQRQKLQKLMLKKPAKCQHVNKMQQALKYDMFPCPEDKAAKGAGAVGEAVAETAGRRLWEEELVVEPPRSHVRRLAAAWV